MTSQDPESAAIPAPMVRPFPRPGNRVHVAYRELHLAVNGTAAQKQAVGPAAYLPRPWEPSTCANPELRSQLWAWLDEVVLWLNHEHTWDVTRMIPTCWPQHPHLIRELAVLTDQRRRATLALSSDPLEDWHRYTLPTFTDRMRATIKDHCEEGHQAWPSRSRHRRANSQDQRRTREATFTADLNTTLRPGQESRDHTPLPPSLSIINGDLVDADTGEIQNPAT